MKLLANINKRYLSVNRNTILIALLLFLSAFGFRLLGITSQFEVWDEIAVVRYGEQYVGFIKDGDFSKETWKLNKEHPPFSKYFYGASRSVSMNVPYFSEVLDQDYVYGKRYSLQRIISAFIGSLSVVILFLFIRKFYKDKVAVVSALILSFTPYFLAHSLVATQENLIAFFTLSATAVFFIALKEHNLLSKKFLLVGLIMGIAVATKFNAVYFLLLFAVLTLLEFWPDFKKDYKKLFKNYIILIPIISIVLLVLLWPWLWSNPVTQLASSLGRISDSRYLEYFLGQYPSPHPWYYFFAYFFATTPVMILISLFFFFAKVMYNRQKYDVWFLLYFLTPFLAVTSPLKMDGIRYIFTVYPALAVVSAIGIFGSYFFIKKGFTEKVSDYSTYIFSLVVVSSLIFIAVIYKPYYWDFYNSLVGGPKNVYEKRLFDFGYWGEGLREAMVYINGNAEEGSTVYTQSFVPTHVFPSFAEGISPYSYDKSKGDILPDYVIMSATGEWISYAPMLEYYPEKYEQVYEESIMEAPIVKIFKLKEEE